MLLPDVHAVGPVHELVGGAALVAEGLELLDEPVLLQLGLGVESGLGIGLGLGLGLGPRDEVGHLARVRVEGGDGGRIEDLAAGDGHARLQHERDGGGRGGERGEETHRRGGGGRHRLGKG